MSESVWFEQVDTAFVSYLKSVVRFGEKSVPVSVRKPDEDFKIESYPSITLYNLYSKRDEMRYFPDSVVVSQDINSATLVEEKSAIPYNLFYQLDFWSKSQSQMNDMTRMWLGANPDKCFNLDVKDMSGKDRSSFVLLTDDLKKSDMLDGTNRLFHSFLTYKVWVEIDENISVTKPMITGIEVR